jgi:hypothetical protein
MVTLSQFFLPAPDLATRMADALADEGVVVQAGGVKAPHIFGGPGWRMLSSAAVQHIAGLLDISFVNVLVGAWNKSFAVGQQIEKSLKSPGKDLFLQLAEHKITSKHEPHLALLKDGQEIGRLPFSVSLELVLQGAVLRIRDGEIKEIETSRVKGKGSLKCAGATLIDKELQPISLPGTLAVGLKVASPPDTPDRLSRAS